jgi:predicted NAD-dependent protein-ADP-ribosyltransferase YbiA (DUF1768 family)
MLQSHTKTGKASKAAIRFNSKTREHNHFSNSYPFVKHNTLRYRGSPEEPVGEQVGHLVVTTYIDNQIEFFNSVDSAYAYSKYMAIDPSYAKSVLLPVARTADAKSVKALGSKSSYISWKSRTVRVTQAAAGRHYKAKYAEFRHDKLQVMLRLLWSKYTLNSPLQEALLATGNRKLHEIGNPSIWTKAGGDALGKLHMHVREHLRCGSKYHQQVVDDMPLISTSTNFGQED